MFSVITCIVDEHDRSLVAAAALVCIVGCIATVLMLSRADRVSGTSRRHWVAAAAFNFGISIWATHFIAMLAYEGGVPIAYGLPLTTFSIFLSIAACWLAFGIAFFDPAPIARPLGGAVAGLGIAAMHFAGMLAIEAPGHLTFDWTATIAATLLGAAGAAAALYAFGRLTGPARLAATAGMLAIAVCTLHFTSMSGVTITPDQNFALAVPPVPSSWLAGSVIVVSTSIILIALGAVFIDRQLTDLRGLADASLEGLMIVHRGRIVEVNERFTAISGHARAELVGQPSSRVITLPVTQASVSGPAGPVEIDLLHAEGDKIPVDLLSRTIEYRGRNCDVHFVTDLRPRKEAERMIEHLAHHDSLTGLFNRSSFEHRIRQAISLADARQEEVAVFYLDLDRFKAVNDIFGHHEGDRILQKVADILRSVTGVDEMVARLGGDEFAIIQTRLAQPDAARLLVERIFAAFSQEIDPARDPMGVGVSIGVALYPADGDTAERLCNNADTALYRAKHTGKGASRFFDASLDEAVRTRRQLETDLRHAIARRQFYLDYQPIFDVRDDEIVGYEALLRWQHPDRGLLAPDAFVSVAEESGSIIQIGEWVLEQACAEAAKWQSPLTVAVNLSPVQFMVPNLVGQIKGILTRTGLEPERLELEITEAVLLHNREEVMGSLNRLHDLGVHIVMDDFGTGYSSLSNLQSFPFDKIKIDRSFTAALDTDPAAHSIMRAIIALGKSLNLLVVTEGVETEHQKQMVIEEGGVQVQGYLMGRPTAAPSLAEPVAQLSRA
ncbi:MAG: EAL domain-containing protein [Shinella sp.]|nr:EAL domain-containing protein [Shinella sp.]